MLLKKLQDGGISCDTQRPQGHSKKIQYSLVIGEGSNEASEMVLNRLRMKQKANKQQ